MKSMKILVPALIAFLVSCSKSDDNTPATDPNAHQVSILASQFDPNPLTMQLGSKVVWTNRDGAAHSIVSDDGVSFNSGTINPGGTFNFTFTVTGTYEYHCGIHPADKGMLYVVTR